LTKEANRHSIPSVINEYIIHCLVAGVIHECERAWTYNYDELGKKKNFDKKNLSKGSTEKILSKGYSEKSLSKGSKEKTLSKDHIEKSLSTEKNSFIEKWSSEKIKKVKGRIYYHGFMRGDREFKVGDTVV